VTMESSWITRKCGLGTGNYIVGVSIRGSVAIVPALFCVSIYVRRKPRRFGELIAVTSRIRSTLIECKKTYTHTKCITWTDILASCKIRIKIGWHLCVHSIFVFIILISARPVYQLNPHRWWRSWGWSWRGFNRYRSHRRRFIKDCKVDNCR
jgi:hypothetical protein